MNPGEIRTMKALEEFNKGPNYEEMRIRKSPRVSGAFPLPCDMSTPLIGKNVFSKRPFDDTILNQNDSLIKKKQRRSLEESGSESTSDSVVLASPWELRRMKGELIDTKAQIMSLEAQVNSLNNIRRETEILFDQERSSLKQTIERDKYTIQELEIKLKKLRKREQALKEQLDSQLEMAVSEKQIIDNRSAELLEENLDLKKRISDLEIKGGETERELANMRIELTSKNKDLEAKAEQYAKLTEQINELRAASRQHEKDKAQLIIAEHKIGELESELKNHAESTALVKSMQNKLLRCSELERQITSLKAENAKHRETTTRVAYLEGLVEDFRAKLASQEDRDRELKDTRVSLLVAEGLLADFRGVCSKVVGDSSPSQLASYVRELQHSQLEAKAQAAALQAKLKGAEETCERQNKTCEQLRNEMARSKVELEQCQASVRRLKKQHMLITSERDLLRKMLDSVEKETTVCSDSQVESLTKLVDGYRKRIDQMEQEQPASSEAPANLAELEALKKDKKELLERIDSLEEELAHRNLKGDFDTRDTKILHFKMNPASLAEAARRDELESTKAELAVVKEKLRLLQQGHTMDLTLAANDRLQQMSSKELDELREKANSLDVQNQRLKEAFKKTSHEFREAVYALLGYNIVPNKKQFKLTSMYADSPDQHLLFQMTEGGMELLETPFSQTLSHLIDVHLCQNNSIPLFLCGVTSDLFTRHSQSILC